MRGDGREEKRGREGRGEGRKREGRGGLSGNVAEEAFRLKSAPAYVDPDTALTTVLQCLQHLSMFLTTLLAHAKKR